MNRIQFLPLIVLFLSTVSCSKEYIRKVLKDNPEIISEVIKDNPKMIIDALNEASLAFRKQQLADAQKEEVERMEKAFKNPKKPEVSPDRAIFGDKNAPITIVEYSDFQCPFCARAANTMEQLLKNYEGKIRVVYKHLPLPNHPQAEIAAKYYEAVAEENEGKAKMFHDKLFENQSALSQGEKLLEKLVKEVGLDVAKVKKNLDKVADRVEKDKKEAEKFQFSGTPAFLIGGIPLSGARNISEFRKIIDRHLSEMEK